jgi:hypothetical protein
VSPGYFGCLGFAVAGRAFSDDDHEGTCHASSTKRWLAASGRWDHFKDQVVLFPGFVLPMILRGGSSESSQRRTEHL